ncbi:uncharacterized protein LOC144444944 [Glandiceps talaboti]
MAPVNGDTVMRAPVILYLLSLLFVCCMSALHKYDREELLHIRTNVGECQKDGYPILDILEHIPEVSNGGCRKANNYTQRGRKRGKRGGALVRLRRRSQRPPLPSIILANVRSLSNKIDELNCCLDAKRDFRDCSVFCFTETWLNESIPDSAVQPPGFTIFRCDRSFQRSNKVKGGGVCFMINNAWYTDVKILQQSCSPELESLTIKCRPLYLPREFSSIILTAVYIPPRANTVSAINQLSDIITRSENLNPGSFSIITGDFNRANLRKDMPKYYQQVTCTTRGSNTLDHCYTTIKNAYRSIPRAPLGNSDHSTIFLVPAYRQELKRCKPVKRSIPQWTDDAIECLRACFDATDWGVFKENAADLDEYTETVIHYIKFCENICIPVKAMTKFPNDKPWFDKNIRQKIIAKQVAYQSKDDQQYKKAKYDLRNAIKQAKRAYKDKLEVNLTTSNTRDLWQGLQRILNYKSKSKSDTLNDQKLANELNIFFSRFDKQTVYPNIDMSGSGAFSVSDDDVRHIFAKLNVRKAAGPDEVSPRLLRACSSQLSCIFADIFNRSLSTSKVPSIFKKSIIIPVPKKATISQLNDYRPIALTSVVMKVFERLVLKVIKSSLPPSFDPYQFAYHPNRSVEDAVSLALHYAINHLEKVNSYVRILFIDYSSAFNTIIPANLHNKLLSLGLNSSLCNWIFDFLSNRPQVVKTGSFFSEPIILNTGAPQGCVLSPMLYSLVTHDCASSASDSLIFKFADDTSIVGLIQYDNETAYRDQVDRIVGWCADNNLELNVDKTKEIIVDFRKKRMYHTPLNIHGKEVEIVDTFKFLGSLISEDLKWEKNVDHIVKKAQQRLFFLRRLKSFGVSQAILKKFYRAVVESVLTFSITVWYGNTTHKDRAKLNRIVRTASRIIGIGLPSLESLFNSRVTRKTKSVIKDINHPAHTLFELLPSGTRYRSIKTKTNRFKNSFYPLSVRILNDS